MKIMLRGVSGCLIITLLTFLIITNISAATISPATATNLNLTNLINGMDLNQEQFNTTLKLTKDFLNQIERSNKILVKLTSPNTSTPMTTNIFEKFTVEQYRFLADKKQYRQNLIKTIGEEKAEKIYAAVYVTIPDLLLPEKADKVTENLTSNPANHMSEEMVNHGAQKEDHPGNMATGRMNSMDNMKMSGPMGMGNMPGMIGNNTGGINGTGTVREQLISQLQNSNAILIQMITTLQSKGEISPTQCQSFLQLLNNQQTLIRSLLTNK